MARFSNPVPQFIDINGVPENGALLHFFETGTTTPKNTYSDAGLSIANTNPVACPSGQVPSIFLDGVYKVVLKDSDGTTIWTRDPVGATDAGQWGLWLNDESYNTPDIVVGSDDEYYRSLTDNNQGNDPVSSAESWEQLQLGRAWNQNIDYPVGDSVYGSNGNLYISIQTPNLNKNPTTEIAFWSPIGVAAYTRPLGEPYFHVGAAPPVNHLSGGGDELSRTTYSDLWDAINEPDRNIDIVTDAAWAAGQQGCWSSGDGSTTFRTPLFEETILKILGGSRTIGSTVAQSSNNLATVTYLAETTTSTSVPEDGSNSGVVRTGSGTGFGLRFANRGGLNEPANTAINIVFAYQN